MYSISPVEQTASFTHRKIFLDRAVLFGMQSRSIHYTFMKIVSDDDDEVMLNVLRCQLTYQGQVVTNAEACSINLYVHGNQKAR